jgi:predicted NBD/HSP70 family sugar kinase
MATQASPGDLAIGIDFGGSGIKGAVVDVRDGALAGERLRIPTPRPSAPREVVGVMDTLVQRLVEPWGSGQADRFAIGADRFPVGVGIRPRSATARP